LSDFNETLNFIYRFFKNNQASNFMKIRPMGAEFFYADGRTDGEMKTWRSWGSLSAILHTRLTKMCNNKIHISNT